jgi:transposase InsO family protein
MPHQNPRAANTNRPLLVHPLPKAELLNGEIFHSLAEAKVLIKDWRRHYNTIRPHSSLGYGHVCQDGANSGWPQVMIRRLLW